MALSIRCGRVHRIVDGKVGWLQAFLHLGPVERRRYWRTRVRSQHIRRCDSLAFHNLHIVEVHAVFLALGHRARRGEEIGVVAGHQMRQNLCE
jgi:hypothetical protein